MTLFQRIIATMAVASSAIGAPAIAYGPAVTPDVVVFAAGAQGIDTGIINSICLNNANRHMYGFTGSSPIDQDYWAVFCDADTSKVTGTTVANPKILFSKRRKDGSAHGALTLISNTPFNSLDPRTGTCTLQDASITIAGVASTSVTSGGTGYYLCTALTAGVRSNLGLSDTEPAAFVGADNLPPPSVGAFQNADPNKISKFNVSSLQGKLDGIIVTNSLYKGLQAAQVASGLLAPACQPTSLAQNETQACMPTLSRSKVASLFSGQIIDWNAFVVKPTSGPAQSLPSFAAGLGLQPSDYDGAGGALVHVCKRDPGIGTQVKLNIYILNNPCAGKAAVSPLPAQAGFPGILSDVVGTESFSNMNTCMNATMAGKWAVGVTTTDQNINDTLAYRFVKLDSVAPTIENAAKGKYNYWADFTAIWPKWNANAALPYPGAPTGLTANQFAVVNAIVAEAKKPTVLALRNNAVTHKFCNTCDGTSVVTGVTGGFLALGTNGFAADSVFNLANPVTPFTHIQNGNISNCRVPMVNPSQTYNGGATGTSDF